MLLGFTSLELVHYSLTVLPSEIPGCGCVTQTHTHTHTNTNTNTYTHKTRKETHIFNSRFEHHRSAVLFCTLREVDRSAEEGEADIERFSPDY